MIQLMKTVPRRSEAEVQVQVSRKAKQAEVGRFALLMGHSSFRFRTVSFRCLLPTAACVLLAAFCILSVTTSATAQSQLPEALREVGIDQQLNEQIPLELEFHDESGKTVRLGQYFGRKPVILTLVYHQCPMLCSEVLNSLLKCLRVLSFSVGKEFEVLTVSFNSKEDAALAKSVKESYIKRYKRDGAEESWHFLTGDSPSIQRLTRSVGFRYTYDATKDLYAHAAGIMLLTPQGRLSRYFFGIEFAPRDLRLGLVEASQNKIGTLADQVLLFCYHYDPVTGKYGFVIMTVVRTLGALFVLGLGTFISFMLRREKRMKVENVV